MLQLLRTGLTADHVERAERETSNSVLVARPRKTPDWDALRLEVMREFRKTLAYLATK